MKEREGEIERHAMQFIATTYRRLYVTHNTGNPIHVYYRSHPVCVCVFLCSYYIVMIARANPSLTRNSCLYCVCTGERESIERDKI